MAKQLPKEMQVKMERHIDQWREVALRTKPQSRSEQDEFTMNMVRFYKALGVGELDPNNVFFVSSPAEGRIVAGLLAAGYYLHLDHPEQSGWDETRLAGLRARLRALPKKAASLNDWFTIPYDVDRIVKDSGLHGLGRQYIANAYRMWHGGNMNSSGEAFVSFLRDVVKVEDVNFSVWNHWEKTTRTGGGRFMHQHFVVCCDFPTELHYDDRGRMHAENGPHARWSDGTAIYFNHGVAIPAWIIEQPERITARSILDQRNAEVRRVMIEKMTPARFVQDAKAVVVDQDKDSLGFPRRLLRVDIPQGDPVVVVEVTNSSPEPDGSHRLYHLRVDPEMYDGRAGRECQAAVASTWRRKRPGLPLMFEKPEDYVLSQET